MPPVTRAAVPKAKAAESPKARKAPRQARDGERTRATILEVATAEFARHGFAGARVERITGAARINDRMLYYYFGSKEKLFVEVLEQVYGDLRAFEEGLNLMALPPVDAVRKLLYANWTYYQQHPEFIALVANENLYLAAHLKRSARTKNLALPIVTILEKIVMQGARDGVFRDGIDVVNLYIAIAGFNYFYLSNQYTLSAVLKTDLAQARVRDKWRETIEEFVFRYLLADPSQLARVLAAPRKS